MQIGVSGASLVNQIDQLIGGYHRLVDPDFRRWVAPQAIPILKQILSSISSKVHQKLDEDTVFAFFEARRLLLILNDPDSVAINASAISESGIQADLARDDRLVADWTLAYQELGRQQRLLDRAAIEVNRRRDSNHLSQSLLEMSQLASNRALGDATLQLVAKMSVADAPLAKFLESDEIHLREMENRPFSIDGVTSDGSHISTGDWKGQVVLVDFWASCCGPCLAETSRIQSLLKEYSGQGLRVLGICFDDRAEMARHAFSINCDLNWPSIPDQQLSNGNTAISISQRLGVNRFPTVFLIDRKGVLRDVDAHGDLEQAIARYCGRIPENEMGGRGR